MPPTKKPDAAEHSRRPRVSSSGWDAARMYDLALRRAYDSARWDDGRGPTEQAYWRLRCEEQGIDTTLIERNVARGVRGGRYAA